MLLYMCDGCAEQDEGVGHDTADHLRVCGDEWLCEGCYDDRTQASAPRWFSLPRITRADAAKRIKLPETTPLREVQFKPEAGGHAGKCPDCGVLFWTTGQPGTATGHATKCECGASWRSTWYRVGEPAVKVDPAAV